MGVLLKINPVESKDKDYNTLNEQQEEFETYNENNDVKVILNDPIELTELTVKKFRKRNIKNSGRELYLTKDTIELEIQGAYKTEKSIGELKEIIKLSNWEKVVAHEEGSYRKVELISSDNNGEEYASYTIEKAFISSYHEHYSVKQGNIEFTVVIREFDDRVKLDKWDKDAAMPEEKEYAKITDFSPMEYNFEYRVTIQDGTTIYKEKKANLNSKGELVVAISDTATVTTTALISTDGYKWESDNTEVIESLKPSPSSGRKGIVHVKYYYTRTYNPLGIINDSGKERGFYSSAFIKDNKTYIKTPGTVFEYLGYSYKTSNDGKYFELTGAGSRKIEIHKGTTLGSFKYVLLKREDGTTASDLYNDCIKKDYIDASIGWEGATKKTTIDLRSKITISSDGEAAKIFDDYVQGIYEEKTYKAAFEYWTANGKYTSVIKYGEKYDKHDSIIIAYVNYWNYRLPIGNGDEIYPDVIKSMMWEESTCGTNPSMNGLKDVMQMFIAYSTNSDRSQRDPDAYVLARIGRGTSGDFRIPSEGYGAVRNLFIESASAGEMIVDKDKVTPTLSICFGIRWLIHKIQNAVGNNKSNPFWQGVYDYNGGGASKYGKNYEDRVKEGLNGRP